jgi:hypothetical protein
MYTDLLGKIELRGYIYYCTSLMNHFDKLPNEILMIIYSFTRGSQPILCKVNRRWQTLLVGVVINPHYCIDWNASLGYPVNLGTIDRDRIKYCVLNGYHDTLLRAKYSWDCDGLTGYFTRFLRDMRQHILERNKSLDLSFADRLLINIISKCVDRDTTIIADMVILTGSAYLVEETHKLGFPFDKRSLIYVRNIDSMKKLREVGCEWTDGVLGRLMTSLFIYIDDHFVKMEYEAMLEYAIMNGCAITDVDFVTAVKYNRRLTISLMHKHGYVITEGIISSINVEGDMGTFLRGFISK